MRMQPDWELWLDHNLSPIVAKWIKEEFGWNVKSNFVLQLQDDKDYQIYAKAKAAGNIVFITKDIDFTQLLTRFGPPPRIIRLENANGSNQEIWQQLKPLVEMHVRLLFSFNHYLTTIDLKIP